MKKSINRYFASSQQQLLVMLAQCVTSVCERISHRCIFSILAATTILTSSTQLFAEEANVLNLNRTTKPPLSTPEQNGFVDQVATQALAAAGFTMKTVVLPAERALRDANAGILDGELARVAGIEKAYQNLIPVTEKLMDVEFVAFSIKHREILQGWKGLENTSVAYLNGWKILEKNVPVSAEITKVKDPRQLFDLLKRNRVDYVIYEKWAGIDLARSLKIKHFNVINPPLATRPLKMYLHKKHKFHIEAINEALRQLKTSGVYQKIYNDTLEKYARNE